MQATPPDVWPTGITLGAAIELACGAVSADRTGGDIFRMSKILGHSNVMITQKVYACLAPEAWEQDYHRVSLVVPDTGTVYAFRRRKQPAVTSVAASRSNAT